MSKCSLSVQEIVPLHSKENLPASEDVNKNIWQRAKLCGLFYFKDKSISVLCHFTKLPGTCSKVHCYILCACDHVAVFKAKPTGVIPVLS